MKKEIVANMSGVNKTFNIRFTIEYIHPDYHTVFEAENYIQDTGLMKVFEICPKTSSNPKFVGRWDGNKKELDIDIYGVDKPTRENFRKQKSDYFGHKTKLIKPEYKTFFIFIKILGKTFFKGEVFFNIGHILRAQTGIFKFK